MHRALTEIVEFLSGNPFFLTTMCCSFACRRHVKSAVRWTNIVVGTVGLALVSLGIYLAATLSTAEATLYVLALLLGMIDTTMGFLAAAL